ncbi:hypothetical protein V5O48_008474, partial [Marasmius crinis-equi]
EPLETGGYYGVRDDHLVWISRGRSGVTGRIQAKVIRNRWKWMVIERLRMTAWPGS